ncbi:hypothetical protein [Lewinella sp. IMCC34191]|uniref:hypothetical protein n=1 Tax=Lewinella sp. IMCC34191 TaxID=2259172 RepID=UPI0018E54A1E|nr:hypothetical protein [Lewinella sp. IMCC34191]
MSTSFPAEKIDTAIIHRRGLQEQIRMLTEDCNWSERVGQKIDVFWLRTDRGSFFGYSYEYFLDCNNVRLIYWYDNPGGVGTPVDFMIEDLEDESMWVVAKTKHLKTRRSTSICLRRVPTENKSIGGPTHPHLYPTPYRR